MTAALARRDPGVTLPGPVPRTPAGRTPATASDRPLTGADQGTPR